MYWLFRGQIAKRIEEEEEQKDEESTKGMKNHLGY